MTIKWGNKMSLYSQECVFNSKVIHISSFPPPAVIFSQVMCGPVPAGPPLVPPTSGGRVGLVRHGAKRKLRPLSRHKYHNSILNNASMLGRGLTHTDTYTRHKGKTNTHINCCHLQRSFNTNKMGRGCSIKSVLFFNALDKLSDKGKQLQLGLSQEGVICAFVLSWSLVPLNPPLLTVVCVFCESVPGLLYERQRLPRAFAFPGKTSFRECTYTHHICER